MKRIFVLGSINTDLVISTDRVPNNGETIMGGDFFTAQGGKGANQAVAAARLGGHVLMCGKVGHDDFGNTSFNSLKSERIDCSNLKYGSSNSGTAVIIVSNHDNRIILSPGANNEVSEKDVDEFLLNANEGDIFVTQLEIPIKVVGYALKKAHELKMYVILNPAPANTAIVPYLEYVDLITPNEGESALMGGIDSLLSKVNNVLVTLGGDGYKIINKQGEKKYPCMKISPVDTTAAGDTLTGGLAVYLSEGKSLEEAARFGSVSASIACTRKGAQPSIPTRKEIEEILK